MVDKLKAIVDKYPNITMGDPKLSGIEDGWIRIFEEMVRDLSDLKSPIKIDQVKEKFGELRIYVSTSDKVWPKALKIIAEAEDLADHTCEYCGMPGEIRTHYPDGEIRNWIKTLCNTCSIH
jgi:hypothetical protein